MKAELLQGFYLGDLLIEPLKGQVSGRDISEHLTPKAAEVLLQLANADGSMVTRETLLEKVWGTGHATPAALSHSIREIRHALHDPLDDPRFIQTLPRRGYRLILKPQPVDRHSSSGVIGASQGSDDNGLGFVANLQQRGVLEAGLAYLIVGWLLLQIADVVFDQLLLPRAAGTFVTILVIAGFPIVLVLSWVLEIRDGRAVIDTGPDIRSPRQRFSRTYLTVVGALAIALILVFAYDRSVGLPGEVATSSVAAIQEEDLLPINPNSIAVLRFLNIDGSEQTDIFANGFAEEMINRLARIPTLSVSSRGDAWSLGPTASSDDVRRRLRVAYHVEGSVRLIGDMLNVNVKLIDSLTGFQITSRSFDEKIKDFNRVQRDITNVTVANLRMALPAETQSILNSLHQEADLDAYILYRRGRELFEQPRTAETFASVIDLYKQSLRFDPEYAAAHAGLCSTYVALYAFSTAPGDIELAEDACAAALASNPRLNMVYAALGDLYLRTGRTADADSAYRTALAINSQDVQAMAGLASVSRQRQDLAEAERLLKLAIDTQPGNWRAINNLGRFLFGLGRFEEAAETYRRVVFLDPDNFRARGNLGSALTMAGDFEAGRQVYEEALEIWPTERTYSNLGVIYYFLGQFEESVARHRKAVEISPGVALSWSNLADSLHFAGHEEESAAAFRHVRELCAQRLEINPSDSEAIFMFAWSQHRLGDNQEALATIASGLEIEPGDPYGYYYDALIRYESGDEVAALDALQIALDKGYPVSLLVAEPYLGELRANEKFHAMIVSSL